MAAPARVDLFHNTQHRRSALGLQSFFCLRIRGVRYYVVSVVGLLYWRAGVPEYVCRLIISSISGGLLGCVEIRKRAVDRHRRVDAIEAQPLAGADL
jgi:hypothetical protein